MPLPLFLGIAAAAAAGAGVIKKQTEKTKAIDTLLAEAETACSKEALAHRPAKIESVLQKKMYRLMSEHAFASAEKKAEPPISSNWKHIPKHIQVHAAKKYSTLSWNEYSFYTFEAMYYHNRKKGIHELLYYDDINGYDPETKMVDYGGNHQQKEISHWPVFERKMVEQISHVWKMEDEKDTSVLEFCFNNCSEFKTELGFYKTAQISSAFHKQCADYHGIIQNNINHIRIVSMQDGRIELQYWYYFPKVEDVRFYEDDSEEEIWQKEQEQKRREEAYEDKQDEIQWVFEDLLDLTDEIAEIFQKSLYKLYGVLFEKENITFIEEPDFTSEGSSFVERVENVAGSVTAYAQDYVDKHSR